MRRAVYQIDIDGQDISSDLDPLLISLEIEMGDGGKADSLSVELDDSEGQIRLPRTGAPVTAFLYWDETGEGVEFEGFTTQPRSHGGRQDPHHDAVHKALHRAQNPQGSAHPPIGPAKHGHGGGGAAQGGGDGHPVQSSGSRSKGRVLTLTAHSVDTKGKVKQPMQAHADGKTFGDVAQAWGRKAGLDKVIVDPSLASVARPYWAMANESFMAWGTRVARDLGATFKIFGGQAVFAARAGGASATGQALSPITAAWGLNLVDWSITPVIDRPDFGTFAVRHYDVQAAAHKVETTSSGSKSGVTHTEKYKGASQAHAQQRGGANAAESKRDKGGGDSVTIDGEPAAQAEAPCEVVGLRPGADGIYTISTVNHRLSRQGGFLTKLSLEQPSGAAGSDTRS